MKRACGLSSQRAVVRVSHHTLTKSQVTLSSNHLEGVVPRQGGDDCYQIILGPC